MTEASQIVAALQGRWHGSYGMACCPAHQDRTPSLKVSDGDNAVLLYCFAGCPTSDVIDALKARGLWETSAERGTFSARSTTRQADGLSTDDTQRRNGDRARRIWKECRPIAGTLGEVYFRNRGITTSLPGTLRFHPALKHEPTGLDFPAVVAVVTRWPDWDVAAVHRTFLTADGRKKAQVRKPKLALGPVSGGAVRLRTHADELMLAEGIESAMSVCQSYSCSAWACLSSSYMPNVVVPDEVKEITIAGDRDANGAGQKAANKLADRLRREGKSVRIMLPPNEGQDWNDLLREGTH